MPLIKSWTPSRKPLPSSTPVDRWLRSRPAVRTSTFVEPIALRRRSERTEKRAANGRSVARWASPSEPSGLNTGLCTHVGLCLSQHGPRSLDVGERL